MPSQLSPSSTRALLFLVGLLVALDVSSMPVSLPFFSRAHGVDLGDTQWALTAYMLIQASTVLIFAHWGDHTGHWRMLKMGAAAFATGALISLLAPNFPALVGGRIVLATGSGMLVASSVPLIVAVFGAERRTQAMALLTSASSLGAAIGPLVTGFLLGVSGWRGAFWVTSSGMLIVFALLWLKGPRSENPARSFQPDWFTAALFSATIASLLFAISRDGVWAAPALAFGAGLLWRLSTRYSAGRLVVEAPLKWVPLLSIFFFFAAVFFHVLVPSHLQLERRLGPELSGQIMMIYPISVFIGTRLAAYLSRLGRWFTGRTGSAFGAFLSAVALMLMSFATNSTSLVPIMILLSLIGLGLGIFIPFNSAYILGTFPKDSSGLAGGLIATFRSLGIAIGVAIALESQRLIGTFSTPFLFGATLAALAVVIGLVFYRDDVKSASAKPG
jgi:MFS family permease